jgi:hypothetical protein
MVGKYLAFWVDCHRRLSHSIMQRALAPKEFQFLALSPRKLTNKYLDNTAQMRDFERLR